MSEQSTETTPADSAGAEGSEEEREAIDLPPQSDAAFGALMDALAPEEDPAPAGQGDQAAESSTDGGGDSASAGEAKPEGDKRAGADTGGDERKPGEPAADSGDTAGDTGAGRGDIPEEWTQSVAELTPKFGELSTQLEETIARAYHEEALEEVKEEHARYFEAISQHPRQLIGQEVPKTSGEGMEILRDAADAQSWQEAVKQVLVEEVRDRTSRALEENSDFLTTIHSSIELFQNNSDLVPGTKEFDRQLADKFAAYMKDYELRDDEEKLLGYSVPVQPIINSLRTDLAAARAASKTPAASAPEEKPEEKGQQAPSKEEQPQAGVTSKAGNSSEEEDFSTLFGTIGLPNLRI